MICDKSFAFSEPGCETEACPYVHNPVLPNGLLCEPNEGKYALQVEGATVGFVELHY